MRFYDIYTCDQSQMNIKYELSTIPKRNWITNQLLDSSVVECIGTKQLKRPFKKLNSLE